MSDKDEYLSTLYKAYDYCVIQYEKNILYLSSGALGVSMAFIEKIVPLQTAISTCYLITSWYLLATTMLISLLSTFLSFRAIAKHIKNYSPDNKDNEERRQRLNRILRFLNLVMMFGLFAGIIFLITFIQKNV